MIQIEEAIIRKLIFHRIAADENESLINNTLIEDSIVDEEMLLKKIFLKPFQSHSQTFEFDHEIGLEFNVLFNLTKNILNGNDFIEESRNIVQHLASSSKHPNIKGGDLFVLKFDDIKLNNRYYEGLGIYKFEDKDSFIDTSSSDNNLSFTFRKGIGNKKPDKACLVIFTEIPYTILIIDGNNNETEYWQNEFIKQKSKNDFVNNTNNFLTLTKKFITNEPATGVSLNRTDQIDLMNRSVDYFKTHEQFNKEEFENQVFNNANIIESFREFDQNYRQENKVELSDSFEISSQAVKKQARIFKSVLKLDKNFHIYIHGDKELIERGVDEEGRKYYKIYYENEE